MQYLLCCLPCFSVHFVDDNPWYERHIPTNSSATEDEASTGRIGATEAPATKVEAPVVGPKQPDPIRISRSLSLLKMVPAPVVAPEPVAEPIADADVPIVDGGVQEPAGDCSGSDDLSAVVVTDEELDSFSLLGPVERHEFVS